MHTYDYKIAKINQKYNSIYLDIPSKYNMNNIEPTPINDQLGPTTFQTQLNFNLS